MARIRTIKPEFPQSESVGRLSRDARLCFVMLWTIADDSGRLRGNSRMLASLLFPYDDDAGRLIGGWLRELEAENCIARYQVNGDTYIQICNWLTHQKIDKPSPSKLPPFDEASRILANPRECSSGDLDQDLDRERIKERDRVPAEPLSAAPTAKADPDPVVEVFDHWRKVHRHPQSKLDAKRRKVIRDALRLYSAADLCLAISGYLNSPFHMGQNDRATVYDDIALMLRSAKEIDAGLRFHAEPPRQDQSALTRKNVAAIADWVPPELRNAS